MSLIEQAKRTGAAAVDAAKAVAASPKAAFEQGKEVFGKAGAADIEQLAKKGTRTGFFGGIVKGGFNTGAWIIKKPFEMGGWIAQKGFNGVAGFYRKAPLIAVPVTLVAGAMGISGAVRRHAQNRTEEQLANGMAQAQAMAAMPSNAPVSYMNSASYADVQAKMDADRAAGVGPQGQAASVQAARAAVPAPEAAAGPAV